MGQGFPSLLPFLKFLSQTQVLRPGSPKGAPQSPSETPKHQRHTPPERQQACTPAPSQLAGASNFIPGHKRRSPFSKPEKKVMVTLSPGPRDRPTPHPAANSKWGPGAAHLLTRRKRAARGGRVPSPDCLAAGERPAANPGGAPGRRARAAGIPGRSPPAPAPRPPHGEQQHHGSGWTQARRLRGSGSGKRGPCSSGLSSTGLIRPLTARPLAARAAGARAPVTPEGGTVGRGRGAGAGRGAGTREPGAGGAGCG